MKKNEIISYLNNNMPKVLEKIQNTNNDEILQYENEFLNLYNKDLEKLLKNELNDIMVKFDSIRCKIRIIEIKNK